MAKIADVIVKVNTRDIDKANTKLAKAEKQTKTLTTGFSKMGKAVKGVGVGFLAVAAAATLAFRAMDKSLKFADNIAKSAKSIGITAEAFQELTFAAELSGLSQEGLVKGFIKLERASIDAQRGLKTQIDAFADMNIVVEDLKGLAPEELFNKVADGIASIEDPIRRAAVNAQIFGARNKEMTILMEDGAEGIDVMRKSARDLGLVLSNELADAAEKNNDRLETMKKVITTEWVQLWVEWSDTILQGSSYLINLAKAMGKWVKETHPGVQTLEELKAALADLDAEIQNNQKLVDESVTAEEYELELKYLNESKAAYGEKKAALEKLIKVKQKEADIDKQQADIRKAAEDRRQDLTELDNFLTAKTKMEEDAELVKIRLIQDERQALISLNDYKQRKAFEEIQELEINNDQKLLLQQDYLRLRLENETTTLDRMAEAAIASNEEIGDSQTSISEMMANNTEQWTNKASGDLAAMAVAGKASFSEMANSIISDILRMIIKQQIFNALSGFIGGGVSTAAQGIETQTGFTGGASGVLNGSEFANFAKGGVIGTNTKYRGHTTGEAGPEGVLPLKRDRNGVLGVSASGASANPASPTNVTIINNTPSEVSQQSSLVNGEKQITIMVEEGLNTLAQSGKLDKVMAKYGNTRRGIR